MRYTPETVERVRALPTGSIFTTTGYRYRYVKLDNGLVKALDMEELLDDDLFKPEDWQYASGISVLYNPEVPK